MTADRLAALLADPATLAAETPSQDIPARLAQLAALQVALAARLVGAPASGALQTPDPVPEGRLLTAEEAAGLAGVDKKFLYRRAPVIPGVRRLGPKTLRFEERAFRRWLATRKA